MGRVATYLGLNSWQEGKAGSPPLPTYAAITARSLHEGAVHAALVDGSVRVVNGNIELGVWRALGTRADREVTAEY